MNDGRTNAEILNTAFLEAQELITPLLATKALEHPSLWLQKISRDAFPLGQGYTGKTRVFHPGSAIQDSSRTWTEVKPSRAPNPATGDPGYDACRYNSPLVGYGISERSWKLYETTRRTADICLRDVMFKWEFKQILQGVFTMLGDITMQEWENWLRETYLSYCTIFAANATRTKVTWDASTDTISVGAVDLDSIGTLRQELLDHMYQYLLYRARPAGIGVINGHPVFGLVTSADSSNRLLTDNEKFREALLYRNPQFLLNGLGEMPTFKNYAHIHDLHGMRFRVDPTDKTKLIRVWPYKATPVTLGDAMEVDPEYVEAPYELSLVYMNQVYDYLVPPANPTSIAGHQFGPADNLGQFNWLNIQERDNNPLREKGFFFGRYAAAPRPLMYSAEPFAILHRRCTDIPVTLCNTATSKSGSAQNIMAASNFSDDIATNTKVWVLLAGAITAGMGGTVTVAKPDSAGNVTGCIVLDDSGDGRYLLEMPTVYNVAGGWATLLTTYATTAGTVVTVTA